MRMVTVEAVVISVFGALLGVVVGTGLGAAVVRALKDEGITEAGAAVGADGDLPGAGRARRRGRGGAAGDPGGPDQRAGRDRLRVTAGAAGGPNPEPPAAPRGMARRFLDADVLCLREVEVQDVLDTFWRDDLRLAGIEYTYRVVVEGNDPSRIDVAICANLPITRTSSRALLDQQSRAGVQPRPAASRNRHAGLQAAAGVRPSWAAGHPCPSSMGRSAAMTSRPRGEQCWNVSGSRDSPCTSTEFVQLNHGVGLRLGTRLGASMGGTNLLPHPARPARHHRTETRR